MAIDKTEKALKYIVDIIDEAIEKERKKCTDCGTTLDIKGCPLCDGRIK